MCFVVFAAIALSFSGCKTKPVTKEVTANTILWPLTDDIINRTEKKDPKGLYGYQYYLSKPIALKDDTWEDDFSLVNGGFKIARDNTHYNISIQQSDPGELRDYYQEENPELGYYLYVAFKSNRGTLIIPFVKRVYGTNERYEILFSATNTLTSINTIEVSGGRREYNFVDLIGDNQLPYLLVPGELSITNSFK